MQPRTIDAFTFELLPSGHLHTIWRGEATVADIQAVRELSARLRAQNPGEQLLLVDASHAEGLSRAARRELRDLGKDKPWERIAVVGANFHVKVSIELILRALRILYVDIADVRLADSAEEIMPWLEHGS